MLDYAFPPRSRVFDGVPSFMRQACARLAAGLVLAAFAARFVEDFSETAARLFGGPGAQWAVILTAGAAALTLGGWSPGRPIRGAPWLAAWSALCGAASALVAQRGGIAVSGAFLSAAGGFAAAALYARLRRRDPLGAGGAVLFTLTGLSLASLVEWAPGGPHDGLVALATVVAFAALAAWDAERIRRFAAGLEGPADPSGAALAFWLDAAHRPFSAVLRTASRGARAEAKLAPPRNGKRAPPESHYESWHVRRDHVRVSTPPHPRPGRSFRGLRGGL